MKIIKAVVIAAGVAGLAACGGDREDDNMVVENMTAENLVVEDDMNMTDLNAVDGMNATENAVVNDLTTTDADANLANGYYSGRSETPDAGRLRGAGVPFLCINRDWAAAV